LPVRHPEGAALEAAFLDRVAGDQRGAGGQELRPLRTATRVGERTARVEGATLRRLDWVGNFAFDRLARPARHVEVGHRIEQHPGIGGERSRTQLRAWARYVQERGAAG